MCSQGGFGVLLADGEWISARRLLVATGLCDELPGIAGLANRWGRDVLHCPYCHGWEVRDQSLAVLWNGPETVRYAGLDCDLDDHGWVVRGANGTTSVLGIWVAGDLANPRAQLITAAGEGSSAAIAINADLVDEDVSNAVRDWNQGYSP